MNSVQAFSSQRRTWESYRKKAVVVASPTIFKQLLSLGLLFYVSFCIKWFKIFLFILLDDISRETKVLQTLVSFFMLLPHSISKK